MPTTLTWLGHSNFRIASPDAVLLVDPFFEGNPNAPSRAADVGKVDVVCVTHDHDDHLGQALDICLATGATLVAMFDLCGKLVNQGLSPQKAVGMNIGGTVEVAGFRIKMVQAMHSSATGTAAGFIVTLPDGLCLYHSGDTGIFSSMELFGRFHAIHAAMLPIDGRFNMDAEQAAYACKLLRCKRVVPMHWGTFPILAQGTEAFKAALERIAPDTEILALAPGASTTFSSPGPDGDCQCE